MLKKCLTDKNIFLSGIKSVIVTRYL